MDRGWVYVLVNSSMPGLAKVGRTSRYTEDRAAELSASTGVAMPFIVAFEQEFEDCCAAERAVHEELDRRGWRCAANREFFRGSSSDIIRIVLDVGDSAPPMVAAEHVTTADALLAAAERAHFGLGDTMQDEGEALRLYKLAASRGAMLAYERLGQIYMALYAGRQDAIGRRRLLAPLKEGARLGNYYCLTEMAALFASEAHLANFSKAWDLFFLHRATCPLAALEANPKRFIDACCRYVSLCLELGISPGHADTMAPQAEALVSTLLAALDEAEDDGYARRRVAATLRWCYQSLLAKPAAPAPVRLSLLRRLLRFCSVARGVAAA